MSPIKTLKPIPDPYCLGEIQQVVTGQFVVVAVAGCADIGVAESKFNVET